MNNLQSRSSSSSPIRVLLFLFAVVAGITFWSRSSTDASDAASPAAPVKAEMTDTEITSKLAVSVKQTATTPPTLTLTVTNNNDKVLTFLDWDSPLDQAAVPLGLIKIVPEGSSEPINWPTVAFRRIMPPPPESLVTLQPGESKTSEVVLKNPPVPLDDIKGKKAKVSCQGAWMSIWPGYTSEQLTPEMINKFQYGGGAVAGSFESESVDLEIEG